jgi:hypothetical protein
MGTPDSGPPIEPLSREDLIATMAAREDLGPEHTEVLVDSFLAKVEKEIDARVDARLAADGRRSLGSARTRGGGIVLPLGSIALGIPVSGAIAGSLSGDQAMIGLAVAWAGIAAINIAHVVGRRPKASDLIHRSVWTRAGEATRDGRLEIRKLAKLRDSGILTEAEFQAKKTELLARM